MQAEFPFSRQERLRAWVARLPWILAGSLLLLISLRLAVPAVGVLRDDGIYLSSARALASGKGYVIDILPGEPPNTKYPPLTSLLITPLFAAGLDPIQHPAAFKAVPFLFLVVWLSGLRRLGLLVGLGTECVGWVIACTTASAWVAYCGTMIMSDIPAAALITWGMVFMLRPLQDRGAPLGWTAAAALLLGLAFLTRTHAAAAVAGTALFLLARRDFVRLVLLCGICLLLAAPWLWWVSAILAPQDPVMQYYSAQNYRDWWAWKAGGITRWLEVAVLNFAMFLASPSQSIALGAPILGSIAFAPVLVLAARSARLPQMQMILHALLAPTAAALLWQWRPMRLLLFVFPLVWMAAFGSGGRLGRRFLTVLALLFCLRGLWLQGYQVRLAYQDRNPPLFVNRADSWDKLRQVAGWLAKQTAPGETIGTLHDGALPLLSGRKALFPVVLRPFALTYGGGGEPLGTPGELAAALRRLGIRFVAQTPSLLFAEAEPFRHLIEMLRESPDGCMRLAADLGDGYQIYEFTCLDRPSR